MERATHSEADLKAVTIGAVLDGRLSRAEAATQLKVSTRTIANYLRKFRRQGVAGLHDQRQDHPRKISLQQQQQILKLRLRHRQLSDHWIRDHLKLPVSVEAVRQLLAKNHLNRRSLKPQFRAFVAAHESYSREIATGSVRPNSLKASSR